MNSVPNEHFFIYEQMIYLICINALFWQVSAESLEKIAKDSSSIHFSTIEEQSIAVSFDCEIINDDRSMLCGVFFYGGEGDDTLLVSHVVSNMDHLKSKTAEFASYRICLHFPTNIPAELAETKLFPVLGKTFDGDSDKGVNTVLICVIGPIIPV